MARVHRLLFWSTLINLALMGSTSKILVHKNTNRNWQKTHCQMVDFHKRSPLSVNFAYNTQLYANIHFINSARTVEFSICLKVAGLQKFAQPRFKTSPISVTVGLRLFFFNKLEHDGKVISLSKLLSF